MPHWVAAVLAPLIALSVVAVASAPASATATPVPLGTADSFAVLAGQTVTNTGPSVITGDLGVSPGTAITGFPPGLVNGVQYSAGPTALQAQSDLVAAFNNAAGQATDSALPPDAGGLTLVPGVYTASSDLHLTGTLTLDAQGNPNAVWVFQVGSALITSSASRVLLINGASPCNVFWEVGSSATLGTQSTFVGNILALTSISATTGASIDGRALARNGSVTLDTNRITRPQCATGGTTGGTTTGVLGGVTTGGTTTGVLGGVTTGTTTGVLGGVTTGGTTGGLLGGVIAGTSTGATGGLLGGVIAGPTTGGTTGATTVGTTGGATGGNGGYPPPGHGYPPPGHGYPPPGHGYPPPGHGDHPGKPGKPGHGHGKKPCKPKKPVKPKPCKPKKKPHKPSGYGDNQGYGAKPDLHAGYGS
jgi:hypothetical protein